jgi:hypothetical protein
VPSSAQHFEFSQAWEQHWLSLAQALLTALLPELTQHWGVPRLSLPLLPLQ